MSHAGNAASPIDPDVVIPAAVRRASANADAVHKSAYQSHDPATPPATPAPAPTTSSAPVATAPVAPLPTPVIPDTTPNPGEDSWENRFKAMKGRHDNAVVTMNQQQQTISSLEGRLVNMEGMMSRMSAAPPAPPADPQNDARSLVSQADIDTFGPEFMDVVARVAKQHFSEERSTLEKEIGDLRKQVGGVAQHVSADAQAQLFARMDQEVPDWRVQNDDAQFLAWLRLPDPYSGAIRHELLKQAFARNDTARVLNFFKGFRTEEAAVAPPAPPAPPSGRPSLEDLAAPGRAKSEAAGTGSPEKPIISRAQITQFYSDVRANKYRGRDEEKNRLENMIFDAERDGRIR